MILITGGAFQGKTDYALHVLGVKSIADCEICAFEDIFTAECLNGWHKLVRRLLNENMSPAEYASRLINENPSAVVITDEIGGGIIPIEKRERIWRSATGSSCCILADFSHTVIRIICGIPTVIKGERS